MEGFTTHKDGSRQRPRCIAEIEPPEEASRFNPPMTRRRLNSRNKNRHDGDLPGSSEAGAKKGELKVEQNIFKGTHRGVVLCRDLRGGRQRDIP
jgi:hypothetical protein